MTRKQSAKRFAEALFQVSRQHNVLDQVRGALIRLNDLVKSDSQFRSLIQSKRIAGKDKAQILTNVLGDNGHSLVSEIVSHLDSSNSVKVLNEVTLIFDKHYKDENNIISVKGTVAQDLDESQKQSLKSSLDTLLGKNIDLSLQVDESLIGGIRLRIENTFLDATVQNQLQTLRRELTQS